VKDRALVFWLVFRHEGRVLLADRTLWLLSVLLLLLTGYGIFNGVVETNRRDRAIDALVQRQRDGEAARLAQWRRIMAGTEKPVPFANPTDPSSMGSGFGARFAVMPTRLLAPIAFGQSDLFPTYYQVSNASKVTFMYDTEIENPWHLLSGHFDLSFVLVYLCPLLILAVSYNLLSVERERGTLKMLLSQPLSLPVVVLGKVALRVLLVLASTIVIPACVLIIARPSMFASGQAELLLWWGALVVVYSLFWFAMAVLVNALGRSSAANALMLIATWVVLVLVVPVVLNLLVSAVSPAPSRTELATRTRLATIDTMNSHAALLSADYEYTDKPELLLPKDGKIEIAGRPRAFYLTAKDVDERLQPVLDTFQTQTARQQSLVSRLGVASPAVVAYERMVALAGNGTRRYSYFQQQVDTFHRKWREFFGPKILEGIAITETDFERFPQFNWQEEDKNVLRADILSGLAQLIGPTIVAALYGAYRLRSYPIL
jgi:ABC-2 type transport system permease protein